MQKAFGFLNTRGWIGRNHRRHLDCSFGNHCRLDELIEESAAKRLLRIDTPRCQQIFLGFRQTNDRRQLPRVIGISISTGGVADVGCGTTDTDVHSRSEEHTSELHALMRISYAVFCLKKKQKKK